MVSSFVSVFHGAGQAHKHSSHTINQGNGRCPGKCHPYRAGQFLALLHLLSVDSEQPPLVLPQPAVWPVEVRRLFFLALIPSVFALQLEQGIRWPVFLPVASVLHIRMPRKLYHHLHAIYLKAKLTLPLPCQVLYMFFGILYNFIN